MMMDVLAHCGGGGEKGYTGVWKKGTSAGGGAGGDPPGGGDRWRKRELHPDNCDFDDDDENRKKKRAADNRLSPPWERCKKSLRTDSQQSDPLSTVEPKHMPTNRHYFQVSAKRSNPGAVTSFRISNTSGKPLPSSKGANAAAGNAGGAPFGTVPSSQTSSSTSKPFRNSSSVEVPVVFQSQSQLLSTIEAAINERLNVLLPAALAHYLGPYIASLQNLVAAAHDVSYTLTTCQIAQAAVAASSKQPTCATSVGPTADATTAPVGPMGYASAAVATTLPIPPPSSATSHDVSTDGTVLELTDSADYDANSAAVEEIDDDGNGDDDANSAAVEG